MMIIIIINIFSNFLHNIPLEIFYCVIFIFYFVKEHLR